MQTQSTIRCTSCGQPYQTTVRTVVDVAKDPQGKALLLNGQLNTSQCPNCGNVNALAVPLLYHDTDKELLIALIPMELNMNKDQQERTVGDLMKALPKENFKGYMFNPRRALTMQGLLEQVLAADGVTPEMMEAQRQRVLLIQQLVEASDAELPALITQNDAKLDLAFFQAMGVMAQRMAQGGRRDMAEAIIATQQVMLEYSTFGKQLMAQQQQQDQIMEAMVQEVQALGDQAQRSDFLTLARTYAGDDQRLQALVGLARPVFDYQFFQEMTAAIGQAPAAERPALEALRDRLTELTRLVDEQAQLQVQSSVGLLQAMLSTPPEELDIMLRENLPLINDTFMAVLSANIQEADRRRDPGASARLKRIYDKVVAVLQETMQPELVFVNQLLSVDDANEARQMLEDQAKEFGEPLLEIMDAVEQVLSAQGDTETARRLSDLRKDAVSVLSQ